MKSEYDEIENKIKNWKIQEYGKIAMKFRRGIIDLSEAQDKWNYAEYKAEQLLGIATDPDLSKIVSFNFEENA